VKLQLIAGAQLALAWVRIWKPNLNSIDKISQGFPPKRETKLGVCMSGQYKAIDEPPKRMIDRLLQADTTYSEDLHYLDPILSDPVGKQDPM
jgi:hypothetical protein